MSKKIEQLDKTTKDSIVSTSIPDIKGQDFRTPSLGTLSGTPTVKGWGIFDGTTS